MNKGNEISAMTDDEIYEFFFEISKKAEDARGVLKRYGAEFDEAGIFMEVKPNNNEDVISNFAHVVYLCWLQLLISFSKKETVEAAYFMSMMSDHYLLMSIFDNVADLEDYPENVGNLMSYLHSGFKSSIGGRKSSRPPKYDKQEIFNIIDEIRKKHPELNISELSRKVLKQSNQNISFSHLRRELSKYINKS